MRNDDRTKLDTWLTAAERRYSADLRVQEITRALRALSSAYVERRERGNRRRVHGALDTAGKRAAFALYYAPLHFIAVTEVVQALHATESAPRSIVDLGCGTGAAGAAWALAAGIDAHSDRYRPTPVGSRRSTLDAVSTRIERLCETGRHRPAARLASRRSTPSPRTRSTSCQMPQGHASSRGCSSGRNREDTC